MNCEISEALKRLAGEYEHATTQKERDRLRRFDDPSKVATFSDGGKGAESVRNGGVELPEDVLEEALEQLSERDKAFVCDVLNGKRWAELGMPKATFYRRLKKVEAAVRLTP